MADEHYTSESWRVISDAPLYAISSFGRVMRISSVRDGCIGKMVAPWLDGDGYALVTLRVEGGPKGFGLHVLVCKAFNSPRPSSAHQVAHNNGIKTDNRPENLRWATAKENSADRTVHGTAPTGARNPRAKLTVADVLEIRRHKKEYGVSTRLGLRYGVSEQNISCILAGKSWAHIPWEDGTAPQSRVTD